jgi:hypothetical protein
VRDEGLTYLQRIDSTPIAELTPEERLEIYAVLGYLSKRIKERLDELRPTVLEDTQVRGKPVIDKTGKSTGSIRLLDSSGTEALDKRTDGKEPDQDRLFALLEAKKIRVDLAYDLVQTYTYSNSKVARLIDRGFLTVEEVEALKKTTHALTVKASPMLIERMDQRIRGQLPDPE